MKIAKLHKPQPMGNWKNVLAYSSEEDEENPDALADAEAAANPDSTDNTGVQITDRGLSTTRQDSTGRITFTLDLPFGKKEGAGDDPDSTIVSVSGGLFGVSAGIEIAIPLNNSNSDSVYPPNYMGSGPVEYDQFGNPLYH